MKRYGKRTSERRIDRRDCLRGLGVSLSLPVLESLMSPSARAEDAQQSGPKRLVCIGTYLGFHQADFFPKTVGREYESSPVLEPLKPFRSEMSIFSGLDHRGRNGHEGWKAWMSGSATGGVSMDSIVADHVGEQTRFASLQLTCGRPPAGARLSYTREGVALPMVGRPSVLYETLFRSETDKARVRYLLNTNASVLDGALEEVTSLQRNLTTTDKQKLDEYLVSVRDVEKKLQKQQAWLNKPAPRVDYTLPEFDPVAPDLSLECESMMYDLMALALATDSTRVMTFLIPGWSQVFTIDGQKLSAGYHGLSHHGNEPEKIAEYNLVGREHVKRFKTFLEKLRTSRDATDKPLLDTTAVIFGSGMGDSNTHDNSNLPTLLVGGGFRHGQHHAIDRKATELRLGDLYLTLLQSFGVELDQFAGANRNLNEYLL